MKTKSTKRRNLILIIVVLALALLGVGYYYWNNQNDNTSSSINSFDECVAAGNPILESYPAQCIADGKNFVRDITNE